MADLYAFKKNIAKKYGVNEAIIIHRLVFYIEKNIANDKHFYDGNFWIFNSKKAWMQLFDFYSESQMKTILQNLVKKSAVKTGIYNKTKYDRTLWYSIIDYEIFKEYGIDIEKYIKNATDKNNFSIGEISPMENTELSNQSGESIQPIPEINTEINTKINTEGEEGRVSRSLGKSESMKIPASPPLSKNLKKNEVSNLSIDGERDYYDIDKNAYIHTKNNNSNNNTINKNSNIDTENKDGNISFDNFTNLILKASEKLTAQTSISLESIRAFRLNNRIEKLKELFHKSADEPIACLKTAYEIAKKDKVNFRLESLAGNLLIALQNGIADIDIPNSKSSESESDNITANSFAKLVESINDIEFTQATTWDEEGGADKFIDAVKYWLAKISNGRFSKLKSNDILDLKNAFEKRHNHAGHCIIYAADWALEKSEFVNLKFINKLIEILTLDLDKMQYHKLYDILKSNRMEGKSIRRIKTFNLKSNRKEKERAKLKIENDNNADDFYKRAEEENAKFMADLKAENEALKNTETEAVKNAENEADGIKTLTSEEKPATIELQANEGHPTIETEAKIRTKIMAELKAREKKRKASNKKILKILKNGGMQALYERV